MPKEPRYKNLGVSSVCYRPHTSAPPSHRNANYRLSTEDIRFLTTHRGDAARHSEMISLTILGSRPVLGASAMLADQVRSFDFSKEKTDARLTLKTWAISLRWWKD